MTKEKITTYLGENNWLHSFICQTEHNLVKTYRRLDSHTFTETDETLSTPVKLG